MKKTTKALYSAAAGLALLAASGGTTYASWVDREPLGTSGDAVQTGDLRLGFANTNPNVSRYEQVTWRLYRAGASQPFLTGTLFDILSNFEVFEVGPGYRLEGEVKVRATLQGETLVAYLEHEPFWESPSGNNEDLIEWFAAAQNATKFEIRRENGAPISETTPLTESGTFIVSIKVQFPTEGFPENHTYDEVWHAVMRMGDLVLDLVQQVDDGAFRLHSPVAP